MLQRASQRCGGGFSTRTLCIAERVQRSSPDELPQRRQHIRHHDIPLSRGGLPEQARGRIPRRIVAAEQPAPVRNIGQQHPDRLAETACQMRHAGVDRDHEIELADQRCRVGKARQLAIRIADVAASREQRTVALARAFLQADELRPDVEQRRQLLQRHRAVVVVEMAGIAGPDEADPRTTSRCAEPIRPIPRRLRKRNVGHLRGDRRKRGAECERKAHQRTMQIEVGQDIGLGDALRHAFHAGQQLLQRRRRPEGSPSRRARRAAEHSGRTGSRRRAPVRSARAASCRRWARRRATAAGRRRAASVRASRISSATRFRSSRSRGRRRAAG